MARNKHPEVTVEKILDVAQQLFLEKGYDNTTIQDIVDKLGGLTKGAVYHHFKSKEDIICALSDKMFSDCNPFIEVKKREDLNGLQKMREVMRLNQSNTNGTEINLQVLPLLKNPRIFTELIEANRRDLSPRWLELIEEGIADGSIQTEYAKEIAELIPLLGDVWLYPAVYPATESEIFHKFCFLKEMLEKMGVPVIDDEMTDILKKQIQKISDISNKMP
jgi:AcrR family transcriptional regulator